MPKRAAAEEEEAFPRNKLSAEKLAESLSSKPASAGSIGVASKLAGPDAKRRKTDKPDKKKKGDKAAAYDEAVAEAVPGGDKPVRHVERLRLHNFIEGVLLVAAVRDCSEEEVQLSLPYHHVGYVSRAQATEPDSASGPLPALTDLYQSGQLVIAVVTAVLEGEREGQTRIELSMRPALVNAGLHAEGMAANMWLPAVVQDEQEHVFRLGFGVEGVQGVLKKDQASKLPFTLCPGLIVPVGVQAVTSKGTVKCVTKQADEGLGDVALSVEMLKAGFLVQAKVTKVFRGEEDQTGKRPAKGAEPSFTGGLMLRFCGSLSGLVHWHHQGDPAAELEAIEKHQEVTARVIAVVPTLPPVVHLTLLPHLVSWTPRADALVKAASVGQRMQGKVLDYSNKYGCRMVCSLTAPSDAEKGLKLAGFCPVGRLQDKGNEVEVPDYGKKIEVRVLAYDFMEANLVVTRRPYDMKEDTLVSVVELTPGQLVTGTVTRVAQFGVFVKLSEYVHGLVHLRQLTDVPLASVPKRFTVGTKMKCRVLRINPSRRQVNLTAKKSLVNSDFQLCKLEQARKDMLVTGFVSNVQAYGHIVTFYAGQYGLIPVKEFEQNEAPALGMVVNVRIRTFSHQRKRMLLTLDLDGGKTPAELGSSGDRAFRVSPGHYIKDLSFVRCIDEGIIVSFKALPQAEADKQKEEEAMQGFVPLAHLADDLALAKQRHAALASAKDESALPDEGVILARKWTFKTPKAEGEEAEAAEGEEKQQPRYVLVSLKPSLRLATAEKTFVTKFSNLKECELYTGYVKQIHDFGAFVSVGAWRLVGLAPKHQIAEHFVESPQEELSVGQTVRVHVSRIDPEMERFTADLRPTEATSESKPLLRREAEALRRFFAARAAVEAGAAKKSKPALAPGAVLDAEVSDVKPYGALLSLKGHEGLTALALQDNTPEGTKLETGDSVRCAVLDFDLEKGIVDVSLQAELVAAAGKSAPSKASKKKKEAAKEGAAAAPAEGQELMALPALQKPAYSVLWTREPPAVLFAPPFGQRRWTVPRPIVVLGSEDAGGVQRLLACCPHGGEVESRRGPRVPRILRPNEELQVGAPVTLKIKSFKNLQIYAGAPVGVRGHLHVTQCLDSEGDVGSGGATPLEAFKGKRTIEGRILDIKQRGENSRGKLWHLELTCRPSLMKACDTDVYKQALVRWATLQKGQRVAAAVLKVKKSFLWMEVGSGIQGCVAVADCSHDPEVLKEPSRHFKRGEVYQALVLNVHRYQKKLDLSLVESKRSEDDLVMVQLDYLENVAGKGIAATFWLPNRERGYCHITELFDFWATFPQKKLKPKAVYEARVIRGSVEEFQGKAELSLRASVVHGKTLGPQEQRPLSPSDLKVGQKVAGYVVSAGPMGVFVALSRQLVARIRPRLLSDEGVNKDAVEAMYPAGELVQNATVVDIKADKGHVELSLRKGDAATGRLTAEQLSVGDIVGCAVKGVQKYGIFVRIDNSRVDALIHSTDVSDTPSVSLDSFKQGMRIPRAKVTKVEGNRLWLGIKSSLFDGDELQEDDSDDSDEEPADAEKAKTPAAKKKEEKGADEAAEEEEGGDEEAAEAKASKARKRKAAELAAAEAKDDAAPWDLAAAASMSGLTGAGGFEFADFQLGGASGSEAEEGEEEDEAEGEGKKLSKRQKQALKKAEVKEVQEKEKEQAEASWATNPTSVEDFERLLLSQGDTSIVWIRYMAFHLKMSDLERARQVAERAVKHVGFSDAKERFNTWVAFMNLECTFGTEDSADAVFRRASSHNPAKHVHLQLARIHERNKKIDLATKTYEAACRKFGHSKKAWLAFLTFLYRQGDLEGGRKTLPKALAALPRRKHPLVVSKAALLEYQLGSAERGRSVFEGLVDSYPKRTDLWSVYIDAHIRAHTPPQVATADAKAVRSLMERCCAMRLKAVKMRFFFKKWLDFEKRWGDVETQESVRARAREFVEAQAA